MGGESGAPMARPLRGWFARIGWGLPAAAAVVIGVAAQFAYLPNDDATWLIAVARRLLHGGSLYSADLVEINPPLIIWLTSAVVMLADALRLDAVAAWRLFVGVQVALSVWLVGWTLAVSTDECDVATRPVVLAAVATIAACLPAWNFGQRDHLIVLWFLPYVFVTAAWVAGAPVPATLRWAAGVLLGLAVSLKPHYALAVLLIEAGVAVDRRSLRGLVRPVLLSALAVGTSYVLLVVVAYPAFFTLRGPAGPAVLPGLQRAAGPALAPGLRRRAGGDAGRHRPIRRRRHADAAVRAGRARRLRRLPGPAEGVAVSLPAGEDPRLRRAGRGAPGRRARLAGHPRRGAAAATGGGTGLRRLRRRCRAPHLAAVGHVPADAAGAGDPQRGGLSRHARWRPAGPPVRRALALAVSGLPDQRDAARRVELALLLSLDAAGHPGGRGAGRRGRRAQRPARPRLSRARHLRRLRSLASRRRARRASRGRSRPSISCSRASGSGASGATTGWWAGSSTSRCSSGCARRRPDQRPLQSSMSTRIATKRRSLLQRHPSDCSAARRTGPSGARLE